MFDLNNLKWIREPNAYIINKKSIEIITKPYTDLW